MNLFRTLFFNPRRVFSKVWEKCSPIFVNDELYTRVRYYLHMGKKLNLNNPQTFNEKLQWLKLYDHNPLYTKMVDKYAVKEFVSQVIGEEYIIPTLGVWNHFDEIDFDALPNQFVLKTNHSGGNTGVVICKDKKEFDYHSAKKKLERSLKSDISRKLVEWPYRNIERRILAETFLGDDLTDYKFYCFDGEPRYLYISEGLDDHSTAAISFYNIVIIRFSEFIIIF